MRDFEDSFALYMEQAQERLEAGRMSEFEQRVLRAAAEIEQQIVTVHERVACPKCHAELGFKCRRMPSGWVRSFMRAPGDKVGVVLKHSHRERLLADGIQAR